MKISKAIEIITQELEFYDPDTSPDPPAAFMLGIEALKRIQKLRNPINAFPNDPLLGETPEDDAT